MDIKHLKIRHFRGIETLDWDVGGRFLCLVGPGDSTKSTVLDAIELVLTSRRVVAFDDGDFYNADTTSSITIEITVGGVPKDLLSEGKFGYMIQGGSEAEVVDEPREGDEPVLGVRLTVDESLEPTWLVVNARRPEGVRISAFDRSKFGVSRVGSFGDWQFSWGQGSALARLMEEKDDVRPLLAGARRQAKASLNPDDLPLIKESAKQAEQIGKTLGVAPRTVAGFLPHLDIKSLSIGSSILALHDGPIPVRQAGLGTTRLLATGLQHEAGRAGGVTLIDEVEHGLEPHRIRGLLSALRTAKRLRGVVSQGQATEAVRAEETGNHILLTTHSPVVVSELEPSELRVVRSAGGVTTILRPADSVRSLLRKNPDAFLARRVIVCEGKTEIGFCRALDRWWSPTKGSFAYLGTALANGDGNTQGPTMALNLAELGFRTLFFGDSDKPCNPDEAAMKLGGVCTLLWEGGVSIEERVVADLPWEGIVAMAALVVAEWGEGHVRSKLAESFACATTEISGDPTKWVTAARDEATVRKGFGVAASKEKPGWFKRVDLAQRVGDIVIQYWDQVSEKRLGLGISALQHWLYD